MHKLPCFVPGFHTPLSTRVAFSSRDDGEPFSLPLLSPQLKLSRGEPAGEWVESECAAVLGQSIFGQSVFVQHFWGISFVEEEDRWVGRNHAWAGIGVCVCACICV